jgi:hypothetical protein
MIIVALLGFLSLAHTQNTTSGMLTDGAKRTIGC